MPKWGKAWRRSILRDHSSIRSQRYRIRLASDAEEARLGANAYPKSRPNNTFGPEVSPSLDSSRGRFLSDLTMASAAKTRDAVNSRLNYDVSDNEDDPFRDIDVSLHEPNNGAGGIKRKLTDADTEANSDGLGLDEEVKITKKRKPVAKLDEARLLSQPGIPKLRALARSKSIASKLRLKGKGHEYSDAAKLLGYYQLWLDDLYPRAKFADGLQLVEKVGHGKRMQVMRKEWIEEGKPGYAKDLQERYPAASNGEKPDGNEALSNEEGKQSGEKGSGAGPEEHAQNSIFGDLDEGEDDDLFFNHPKTGPTVYDDDLNEPDGDELDVLLAEQTASTNWQPRPQNLASDEEEGDDLDALLAEQPARNMSVCKSQQQEPKIPAVGVDGFEVALEENVATHFHQLDKTRSGAGKLPRDLGGNELSTPG